MENMLSKACFSDKNNKMNLDASFYKILKEKKTNN